MIGSFFFKKIKPFLKLKSYIIVKTLQLMKKLLSILCLAMVVAIFPGCTKKYITPNPNRTIVFNVPNSSWVLSNDGRSYYSVLDAPEIDSYFNDNGGVLVYFSFDNGTLYEQIPQVYDGIA